MPGHSIDVPLASSAVEPRASRPEIAVARACIDPPRFEEVYGEHFPFVWRSVRRLGVNPSAVDDVVQEIFLVVHRRIGRVRGARVDEDVALRHRRCASSGSTGGRSAESPRSSAARRRWIPTWTGCATRRSEGPHERAAEREAVRTLHAILDELDDEKREVFVLAELEQMTVPEIAEAVETNVNTVYSRLRAARRDFDQAVLRHRARDQWRER